MWPPWPHLSHVCSVRRAVLARGYAMAEPPEFFRQRPNPTPEFFRRPMQLEQQATSPSPARRSSVVDSKTPGCEFCCRLKPRFCLSRLASLTRSKSCLLFLPFSTRRQHPSKWVMEPEARELLHTGNFVGSCVSPRRPTSVRSLREVLKISGCASHVTRARAQKSRVIYVVSVSNRVYRTEPLPIRAVYICLRVV